VSVRGCSGRHLRTRTLCANGVLGMADGGGVGVPLPRRDQAGRVHNLCRLRFLSRFVDPFPMHGGGGRYLLIGKGGVLCGLRFFPPFYC